MLKCCEHSNANESKGRGDDCLPHMNAGPLCKSLFVVLYDLQYSVLQAKYSQIKVSLSPSHTQGGEKQKCVVRSCCMLVYSVEVKPLLLLRFRAQ